MESIEQFKLENDKLKERLNNAAKFFREQKAQIEALTKENEELKRTPQESDSKEIESLKEQLATSNAACADMEKAIHKDLEDIEKLKKENDKLKSDYTLLNDEYLNNENILGETLAANKELVESNRKLNLKIDEYSAKLKIQENVSESLEAIKKTHAELQYKYEELTKKTETIVTENNKLENEYDELRKTYTEATMIYNNAKVESTNKIEALSKRIEELNNLNANQSDRISKLDEVCSAKDAEISKLKNVCDELEILRNKNIKENEVLNKNIETQKVELDKLNNEINTYKNYALKIEQIKNILDIPKQVNTNSKPKEQKRMGSYLESKSEIFSL